MRKFASTLKLAVLMLSFLFSSSAFAQDKTTVSGTVLSDDDGSPLVGVSITNATTKKRTQTNEAGYFTIAAVKGDVISFTYVGYVTKEITVGDSKIISTRLVNNDKELDNVVVTGYGIKKNSRELSYQAPIIKGDDVAQTRRDNFINSLAGRAPGITVTSTSGAPGSSAQIVLRGATSLSGNNQPLFIVDGVPLDNSTLNQETLIPASNTAATSFTNRNSDYTNRIADINPEDIEEITVLKGPEATALYGSDGSSGAIIITTKKGGNGKVRVSYDNSVRVENVYRFPEIQNVYNRGNNGIYNPEAYSAIYGFRYFGPVYNPNTPRYDNIRNFFVQGQSQQHNMSVEAGTAESSFRFSTGYVKTNGVVPNTNYDRLTFRLTGATKLGKKVNMSSSWTYIVTNNDKVPKGAGAYYNNLITFPADIDGSSYQNPDGTRKRLRNTTDLTTEFDNPFWDVNKNKSTDRTDRVTGNINLSADPVKWLNLSTILGVDSYASDGLFLTHPQSRFGFATRGFLSTYIQKFRSINGTFRATFKKTIAKKFTNTLNTVFYFEDNKSFTNAQRGEQFYEQDFVSINNTQPLTQSARLTQTDTRKVRFFANYNFGYNNLLFITLSTVREGDSRLSSTLFDKQPFFNYGSASGSFVFSDLAAIKKIKWLNYGKLRVSYATSGKGPYQAYRIDPQFTVQPTTGGGFAGDVFASNRDLRPEFSKNFEIGGEIRLFKNRLSIDIARYVTSTTDQIVANRLSYGTGGVLKFINGGEVESKGWEAQIKFSPIKNKKFNWDVTLNYDMNRAYVKRMPADLPLYYESDTWVFGSVRSEVSVGTSVANLVGTTFQRNDAGQLIISPTSGLPLSTPTYTNIGDRTPNYKIGLINNFTFLENFNLSFNLDIRNGGDVFNGNEAMMILTGTSIKTLDRLQPRIIEGVLADGLQNTANPTKNTITIVPYYRNDYYDGAIAEADFVEKVNWLRLRDITFGYRLPTSLIKRQKLVKSASVFVTGTDLFIITNYSGMDPNVNANNASTRGFGGAGIDYGAIPNPRGINFGIKVQF